MNELALRPLSAPTSDLLDLMINGIRSLDQITEFVAYVIGKLLK